MIIIQFIPPFWIYLSKLHQNITYKEEVVVDNVFYNKVQEYKLNKTFKKGDLVAIHTSDRLGSYGNFRYYIFSNPNITKPQKEYNNIVVPVYNSINLAGIIICRFISYNAIRIINIHNIASNTGELGITGIIYLGNTMNV